MYNTQILCATQYCINMKTQTRENIYLNLSYFWKIIDITL